jgi:polyhydroxybutyrate depolymerase
VAAEAIGGNWELAGEGDDHEFLNALLDDVESRYCVDRNRVHIVGMSLGAWKAAATACGTEGRFAALSLVTVEVHPGACEPMPVVAFHGRADLTVPYGDGGEVDRSQTRLRTLPGAEENIARWAAGAGCDPDPVVEAIGDDIDLRRFENCTPGIEVMLYSVAGGGHTWPGADIEVGPAAATTQTIDATQLTLDFFEAHPRNAR